MRIKNIFSKISLPLIAIKEYYLILVRKLIIVKTFITEHPASIFLKNLIIPKRFFSKRNPVVNYVYKLINTAIEAALLVLAVGILCFMVYYTLGMLWSLYLGTPMGIDFLYAHPLRAATIIKLTELDLAYFCTELTLSCFIICLMVSSVCRVTHISHFFFLSQGMFGKLFYWGPALTGAVTYYIKNEYGLSSWEVTAGVVMIPTYLMFISCFRYSEKLLPEIGEVVKAITPRLRQLYQLVYVKIKLLVQNFMNR